MLSLQDKLAILADAAKYDASCASSAAPARNSVGVVANTSSLWAYRLAWRVAVSQPTRIISNSRSSLPWGAKSATNTPFPCVDITIASFIAAETSEFGGGN